MVVAAGGIFPDLSSNGSQVDLIYNAPSGRVWYRHSNDGGVTFAAAIAISPSGHHAGDASRQHLHLHSVTPNNAAALRHLATPAEVLDSR